MSSSSMAQAKLQLNKDNILTRLYNTINIYCLLLLLTKYHKPDQSEDWRWCQCWRAAQMTEDCFWSPLLPWELSRLVTARTHGHHAPHLVHGTAPTLHWRWDNWSKARHNIPHRHRQSERIVNAFSDYQWKLGDWAYCISSRWVQTPQIWLYHQYQFQILQLLTVLQNKKMTGSKWQWWCCHVTSHALQHLLIYCSWLYLVVVGSPHYSWSPRLPGLWTGSSAWLRSLGYTHHGWGTHCQSSPPRFGKI